MGPVYEEAVKMKFGFNSAKHSRDPNEELGLLGCRSTRAE